MFTRRIVFLAGILFLANWSACYAQDEDCQIPTGHGVEFLPKTTAPTNLLPRPEPGALTPRDCEFYRWAWQTFLYSTQVTEKTRKPAFLSYSSFADVFHAKPSPQFPRHKAGFLALGPRTLQFSNHAGEGTPSVPIADIRQAGVSALLIDQQGNPVFYGLHMNSAYVRFVKDYQLNTPDGLNSAPVQLEFRNRVGGI